jgi:hypothetical protein
MAFPFLVDEWLKKSLKYLFEDAYYLNLFKDATILHLMRQTVAGGKAETRGYSAPASEGGPPESGRHTLLPSLFPENQPGSG